MSDETHLPFTLLVSIFSWNNALNSAVNSTTHAKWLPIIISFVVNTGGTMNANFFCIEDLNSTTYFFIICTSFDAILCLISWSNFWKYFTKWSFWNFLVTTHWTLKHLYF